MKTKADLPTIQPKDVSRYSPLKIAPDARAIVGYRLATGGFCIGSNHRSEAAAERAANRRTSRGNFRAPIPIVWCAYRVLRESSDA